MRRLRSVSCALLPLAAMAACNAIVGIEPATLRDADGGSDAAGDDVAGDDAVGDAATCETASDSENCGACGHSCLGSMCQAGACVPEPLVQGVTVPDGIASDSRNLYLTNNDSILYCSVGGCSGLTTSFFRQPGSSMRSQLALFDGGLFFGIESSGQSGTIDVAPTSTGGGQDAATQIATTPTTPAALIVCGSRVCWIDFPTVGNASVLSCPTSGCTQPTTVTQLPASSWTQSGALASDGINVFVALPTTIVSCPITGCPSPAVVMNTIDVRGLAYFGNRLYFTAGSNTSDGSVVRCDLAVGCSASLEFIATHIVAPWNVTVDDSGIYWTSAGNPGSVFRCALGGCGGKPTTVAINQQGPTRIIVDDKRLYWVNAGVGNNGQVMWVAK